MILAALLLVANSGLPAGEQQFRQAEAIRAGQPMRARGLYERAARLGHPGAQAQYGMLLFSDGKRSEALRWLMAAANQGEPRGMLLWGTALFNGDGTAPDRVQGYTLVARAAAKGLAEAEGTRSEMELVMTKVEQSASAKLLNPTPAAVPGTGASQTVSRKKGKRRPVRMAAAARAPAPAVRTTAVASGPWRIQLGAFRVDGSAEALYGRLSGRLAGKQASFPKMGSLTGLLVGPYASQADAQAACRALGPAQPCIAVKR